MMSKEGCTLYPMIVPTPYSLQSFNFYLIEEAGSLSLLDAGIDTEPCWEQFIQTLHQNGFSVHDLDRIILTHNHQDHIGLINRISAVKEMPVYAHPESIHRLKRDKAFFSLRVEFFRQLYREMGCGETGELQVQKLEKAVRDNEKDKIQANVTPLSGTDPIAGLQPIETPGHSPDHLVFLDSKRKWLFSGDHLISHISSNALVEPDREGRRILTLCQYVDSLRSCMALDADTLFPGHGTFIRNHQELIVKRLSRIEEKAAKIRSMLESGMTTASELAQAYYQDKYHSQFALVMSEIIGLLDYMEVRHTVQKELKHGVWHYYAAGQKE
ncbi:MBL fold metallo-hydrolase [Brevibacillus sp. B_LB10_24]|uniref:MBL fold metallo-hydrolase n=1 Tax=Brevibacillus sp. B_LB10_24 TaxID=3380645 RepID=UPI0038B84EB6